VSRVATRPWAHGSQARPQGGPSPRPARRVSHHVSQTYDPMEWPRWAFVASAALVASLATLMAVVATDRVVAGVAAAIVVTPSVDHVLGKHPPPWLMLTLTLLPLLALNTVMFEAAGPAAAAVAAMLAVFIQGEAVSAYSPGYALAGVVLGGAVIAGHAVHTDAVAVAYWIGGSAIAVTVGYLIRRQQQTLLELRAAQAQLVGEAMLQERQRIAREVHDVIAHSMTVTMMHITAARMAIHRDPDAAVEALSEAERLGRTSLADVRRTVGLLRAESDRATDRALPTAADVAALVAGYTAAGVTVDLDVTGDLTRVDATTGLALYRVVQEALANAARHAPGAPVTVEVTVDDDLTVRVTNPVPAGARVDRGGNGLVGMRERTNLLEGTMRAGLDGDRWTLEWRVPLPDERRCR
jgi:signal transduction histidine kinase